MQWGSTWAVSTHAGINPLGWCACPNKGGTSFDKAVEQVEPVRRTNPFVRLRPIKDDATAQNDPRTTQDVRGSIDPDDRVFGRQAAIAVGTSDTSSTRFSAPERRSLGRSLQSPLVSQRPDLTDEMLVILLAAEDE